MLSTHAEGENSSGVSCAKAVGLKGLSTMPGGKQKVWLALAFAVLISVALAVGCTGFFVNPTLSTLTVNPQTPSLQVGSSVQMTATGTYNDGSVKTLTSNVFWSSSNTSIATVSAVGKVIGVSAGSSSITASSANVSGSTSVTVLVAGLVSITLKPSSGSVGANSTFTFTATGNLQGGGTVDLTSSATWSSSNTQVATVSQGVVTTLQPSTSTVVTISASQGNISGSAQLTVNP